MYEKNESFFHEILCLNGLLNNLLRNLLCDASGESTAVNSVRHVLNELSAVVVNLEGKGKEVIGFTLGGVDLNTTKDGNLATGDTSGTSGDNLINHLLLGIVKSIGEVNHLVRSLLEVLGVGEEHGTNKVLLSIDSSLRRSVLGSLASVDARNVSRRGDGRSTAGTTVGAATTLDGTNLAGGVNTNVGTEDDEAGTAIGDVRGHGTERGDTTEGEACQIVDYDIGEMEIGCNVR